MHKIFFWYLKTQKLSFNGIKIGDYFIIPPLYVQKYFFKSELSKNNYLKIQSQVDMWQLQIKLFINLYPIINLIPMIGVNGF